MGEAYRAEGGAGNGGGCAEGRRPVEKTVDNCEWRRIERGFRGSRVENFCVLGDKKRAMFHVEHRQVRGTGFEVRGLFHVEHSGTPLAPMRDQEDSIG
jgi:hypothetical protein